MMVEARRPDINFVDKYAREAKIIDIAIPGGARQKTKKCKHLRIINLSYLRRNSEFVEAEQSNGGVNCDWSIESCIRYMFEKYTLNIRRR